MRELQIFNHPEFGDIRCIEIDGEPWMVGKDVATALGYGKGKSLANAVAKHVDDDDKGVTELMTPGGIQKMVIINESGLYSLVLSSKLPGAKKFRRWVTSEVLPAIRRTGGYMMDTPEMTDAEIMARALLVANDTIKRRDERIKTLEAKVEADAPKVAFANAVEEAPKAVTVEKFAKATYPTFKLGRNKMFRRLRAEGFLTEQNMPIQKYLDLGWFDVCEIIKFGKSYFVTMITGLGQQKLFAALTS